MIVKALACYHILIHTVTPPQVFPLNLSVSVSGLNVSVLFSNQSLSARLVHCNTVCSRNCAFYHPEICVYVMPAEKDYDGCDSISGCGRGNTSGKMGSSYPRNILERLSELTVWKSPEGLNTRLKSGLESNSKDGKCTVYRLMVA